MTPLSESEIELLGRHLKRLDLTLTVRTEWGAENPDHRSRIHASVDAWKASDPDLHISISHAPGLGGWAAARTEGTGLGGLGFDIEKIPRVTEALVRRICPAPGEFEKAPSPAALWTAKEAAYKSLLGPDQPALVSEIEVTSWGSLSRFETFTAAFRKNPAGLKVRGATWNQDGYQLSLAAADP